MIRILLLVLLLPALSFGQRYSATLESKGDRQKHDMGLVRLSFAAKTVSVRYADGKAFTYPVLTRYGPYLLTRDKHERCTDFWITQNRSVIRIWSNQQTGYYGRITYKRITSHGSQSNQ